MNEIEKAMNPQEALKVLNTKLNIDGPISIVIDEVRARMTGVAALKKQIPKKVTHEASLPKCCTCPNCKNVIDKFDRFGERKVRITYDYCQFCG